MSIVQPKRIRRFRFFVESSSMTGNGSRGLVEKATAGFCLGVLRFGIGAVRGGEEKEAGIPYFFLVVAP
jgi:hypothetical protein